MEAPALLFGVRGELHDHVASRAFRLGVFLALLGARGLHLGCRGRPLDYGKHAPSVIGVAHAVDPFFSEHLFVSFVFVICYFFSLCVAVGVVGVVWGLVAVMVRRPRLRR